MVLAVHPTHRFAALSEVSVGRLDGEKFVSYDSDLPIRRAIDRFLRHHDVQVDVAMEFDNIENIKRAVEIPAGVAILPEPTVAREVKAGTLVAVRIGGQDPHHRLTRPLAIIHRRSRQLGLTAARFLKLLTSEESAAPPPADARSNGHVHAKP
jgi:DNA-binding transcriptional LysR family regulator